MASNTADIEKPCKCEIFQSTPAGNLLLTRVESFGSESARTTTYEYDGAGNVARSTDRIVKSFTHNVRHTPAMALIPEQKSVITNERGLTSTAYTLYTAPTVRTSYSTIPASTCTAQGVVVGGFTLSLTDHAGVTPTARSTAKDGVPHNDVFHYTKRSELVSANLNGVQHGYNYDNIGNRRQAKAATPRRPAATSPSLPTPACV